MPPSFRIKYPPSTSFAHPIYTRLLKPSNNRDLHHSGKFFCPFFLERNSPACSYDAKRVMLHAMDSSEKNAINRRAFIGGALKSAAVLSTLPVVAHSLANVVPSRPEEMALVYDVRRDRVRGYTMLGPVYEMAPYDEAEWESYLRGELQPPIIDGHIAKMYPQIFVWIINRISICRFRDEFTRREFAFPADYRQPLGRRRCELTKNMFRVRTPNGMLMCEHERLGDDSFYAVGRRTKIEIMQFYTLPWHPTTFQACALYARSSQPNSAYVKVKVRYLPTRIWIEKGTA
jgi:hypothetical protein